MAKILILGASGSGKSTSIGSTPELGIKGLNPADTFILACSSKGLPFRGWQNQYKKGAIVPSQGIIEGNYFASSNGEQIATAIALINDKRNDINNIVVDDVNYVMQDYYMANALAGGYDVYKKIGLFMGKIFTAIENVKEKNVILIAHYEEFRAKNNDTLSYRMKTAGNMVNNYITPEGKFEIVLFASQEVNTQSKKMEKFFITNYDGDFPAKSPIGMFDNTKIINDLGYVIDKVNEYNKG